jgi:hypothetical protein
MKRQIRKGVFETNSSSTHSICISKAPVSDTKNRYVSFNIGEYGWENDCVNICDYLYTAILEQWDSDELFEKLKDILNRYSINYDFEQPSYTTSDDGEYRWLSEGYIDHAEDTREFIKAVLSDEDMLMRCLFGNSFVYTGNDNQDCRPGGCNIAEKIIWGYEDDKYIEKPNPYHDSVHYDYFLKEN